MPRLNQRCRGEFSVREGIQRSDLGAKPPFDPRFRFATSWLVDARSLWILRGLISFYAFFVSFFILGWQGSHGDAKADGRSFSYFTVLTYWGLAFYFLFASLHTRSLLIYGRPLLNKWPRPLQVLHSLYYTTIVTLPILVTLVYWGALYRGGWFSTRFKAWSNVSQHALNTSFAFFEIVVPRTTPPPWLHLLPLIVILALYLALAYVTYGTQHFYTYSFLDPTLHGGGRVVAYMFGILAAILVIFVVVWLLIRLRQWITERVIPASYRFFAPDD